MSAEWPPSWLGWEEEPPINHFSMHDVVAVWRQYGTSGAARQSTFLLERLS